jgi:hypothetical protein
MYVAGERLASRAIFPAFPRRKILKSEVSEMPVFVLVTYKQPDESLKNFFI